MSNEYRGEHRIHTYKYLKSAARQALERAEQIEAEAPQLAPEVNSIATLTLTFFAIDALINDIGTLLVPGFNGRASVDTKFDQVLAASQLDRGSHRFRCYDRLRVIRHGWAHSETQTLSVLPDQTDPATQPEFDEPPNWITECTPPRARKLFEEGARLLELLEQAANAEIRKRDLDCALFTGSLGRQVTIGPSRPPTS